MAQPGLILNEVGHNINKTNGEIKEMPDCRAILAREVRVVHISTFPLALLKQLRTVPGEQAETALADTDPFVHRLNIHLCLQQNIFEVRNIALFVLMTCKCQPYATQTT